MPDYRKIVRATPAYHGPDVSSTIIFNLEPGQIVEVLSEDDPTFISATHLGQPVYIHREDTAHASPEEIELVRPEPAPGGAPAGAVDTTFCPQCGTPIEPGARYCRRCGGSLLTHARPAGRELAGFWIRFGAYFIDGIITGVGSTILLVLLSGGDSSPALGLLVSLASIAYYVVGYGLGATLGALVFGLRIETEDGGEPGFGRGFIRWLVSLFSGLALGFGYFWAIWDPKKQTWHDKAAGTFVVNR